MGEQNEQNSINSIVEENEAPDTNNKPKNIFVKILECIIEVFKTLLVSLLVALFITSFIIANSIVPTGSMESTIMSGSRVIGNRLAYQFGAEPERGDIIIFKNPDDESVYFVKRLIGLPGDVIDIKMDSNDNVVGSVYINGEKLEEPYLNEPMIVIGDMHFEVPEDSYFFMGDNRNNSNDARFWKTTYVKKEKLVAKVLFQYWKGFKWLDTY